MADQHYQDYPQILQSKGAVARYPFDRCPESTYLNLQNIEPRQEGALSSRLGHVVITNNNTSNQPLSGGNVHTLSKLRGLASTNNYRYAGCGTNLYRRVGTSSGAYTSIYSAMSGLRFSTAQYRPAFSANPWIFFADSAIMLKDNGVLTAPEQWGIFSPTVPALTQLAGPLSNQIDFLFNDPSAGLLAFSNVSTRSYSNITPQLTASISAISSNGSEISVTTATGHGIPITGPPIATLIDVVISGVANSAYNGTWLFAGSGSTTELSLLPVPGGPAVPPAGSSTGGTYSCYHYFWSIDTTLTGPVTGGTIAVATPASMSGIIVGTILQVQDFAGGGYEQVVVIATTATTFTASFLFSHLAGAVLCESPIEGSIALSTTASITGVFESTFNLDQLFSTLVPYPTGRSVLPGSDDEYINFWYELNVVARVTSMTIEFDVGDGSFTEDYYSAEIDLSGVSDSTPTLASVQRSAFDENGLAGTYGHDWSDVNSYRIVIVTTSAGAVIFQIDQVYASLVGQLNVDITDGIDYDYRYTYWNNNTGTESNPSMVQTASAFLAPDMQSIVVSYVEPTDPQVTHVKIYRRGGSLTAGWFFVEQIPIMGAPGSTQQFVDGFSDLQIASNPLLEIDNDVPLTTTLPVPVNTTLGTSVTSGSSQTITPPSMVNIYPNQQLTVGVGTTQEIVIVQSTTGTTFTAFFQSAHGSGDPVTAETRCGTPVNVATIAFDQAWFAGDPNNPNLLYYSNTTEPESCPETNYIEIGVPSDPIMAIIPLKGQIFIITSTRIWAVAVYPGITPTAYPTASRHGLLNKWAWCIAENQIWYRSADGIYVFNGNDSQYVSAPVEWLFADKEPNLGPMPTDGVVLNPPPSADLQTIFMAYNRNEIFYCYQAVGGAQVRMIYDYVYKRWRPDTAPTTITSMYTEEDTQFFLYGDSTGLIYLDRTGDLDVGSIVSGHAVITPIPIALETPAIDQGAPKNNKIYNEFTLDVDTGGQSLTATLVFDNGRSTQSSESFAFSSAGRTQLQFVINSGDGVAAKNVTLQISGNVGSTGNPAHFYEWHIKAAVDAEFRQSMDSYWVKFGTDAYKLLKQMYAEYTAQDPGGISVSLYADGSATPYFTFTLPQSTPTGVTRTVKQVRFPDQKFKSFRMVATSSSDFQMYGDSFLEWKPLTTEKGYAQAKLGKITAEGNV
jgi:hypothetical protein